MERNKSNERSRAERQLHAGLKQFLVNKGLVVPVKNIDGYLAGITFQAQQGDQYGRLAVSVEQVIDESVIHWFNKGMGLEAKDVILVAFGDPTDELTEAYLVSPERTARKSDESRHVFYPLEEYEVEELTASLEGLWRSE